LGKSSLHHHHAHHYGGGNSNAIVIDPNWDLKTSTNGEFESGLFACCDHPEDCCMAWFFPWFFNCAVASAIGSYIFFEKKT
jgi:hypothetical protein